MSTSARRLALALGLSSFFALSAASLSSAWADDTESGDPRPVIEELEADEANRKVIEEPLANAKHALERAGQAASTGDQRVPPMLRALAMEWATTARDVLRAAAAEAEAMAAAKKAAEVRTKVDRARALLAETQARRGTARAELERLKKESGRHGRDVDATVGAKKDAKAPSKPEAPPKSKAAPASPPSGGKP